MSDDLGPLADDLQAAILGHLEAGGWAGRVRTTPWPASDGLMVEITPEGPRARTNGALVPAEVWRDTAARNELVAHLCRTYLDAAT